MNILLDGKEIDKALTEAFCPEDFPTVIDVVKKAQLRKVAEWLNADCDNEKHGHCGYGRWECINCQLDLLKEAGLLAADRKE